MPNKQREYWKNLIRYIVATEDCLRDLAQDGDSEAEKIETEKRYKHLTDNYLVRRNVKYSPFTPKRKPKP